MNSRGESHLKVILGPLESHFGSSWGPLGRSGRHLGRLQRAIFGAFGVLGGHLRGCGALGSSWVASWALMRAILRAPGASWWLFWELLEANMALLGPSWGHLGAVLGPHWGNLVAKCGSRGSVAAIKCNKVKMHILHHVLFIFELLMPPDK